VLGDVIRSVIVQDRRPGARGVAGIENRRQGLIDNLDRICRAPGDQRIFRSHGCHRLADITHFIARHDRLVIDEDAKAVDARDISAGNDAFDPFHRLSSRRVGRHDPGVGMRRAQHMHMQHARHGHIGGISQPAGNLAWRIDAAHGLADDRIFGVCFHQGGGR
jgi:hypothetical protein